MAIEYKKIFEQVIFLLKILGIVPVPINDSKWYLILFLWWFYLLNYISLLLFTIYTFYLAIDDHEKDLMTMSLTNIELRVIIEHITILLYFRYKRARFRNLLRLVRNNMNKRNFNITPEMIFKYRIIFWSVIVLYTVIFYIYVEQFDWQNENRALATIIYPFKLDTSLKKILSFAQQVILLMHTSTLYLIDGMVALLIIACTVRLNFLKHRWKIDNLELKNLIGEHQEILQMIASVNEFVGFLIAKTSFSFVSSAITAVVQLIRQKSAREMVLQFVIVVAFCLRVFISTESAEDLTDSNEDLEQEIYSSLWWTIRKRDDTMCKLIVMRRCRGVPKICIGGMLMPEINREYVRRTLEVTFLYFVTVRAFANR